MINLVHLRLEFSILNIVFLLNVNAHFLHNMLLM